MILSFNLHSFLRTKQDPCNQRKKKWYLEVTSDLKDELWWQLVSGFGTQKSEQ